jgi:hypothetical protein
MNNIQQAGLGQLMGGRQAQNPSQNQQYFRPQRYQQDPYQSYVQNRQQAMQQRSMQQGLAQQYQQAQILQQQRAAQQAQQARQAQLAQQSAQQIMPTYDAGSGTF